ncbi:DUF3040 domain-containing protein [Actinomycetospora lutea]|uniref:DUF3040 domain-containing protein n=1 Tax=Actinomycetospora lutea TaxID=663604 RepID=UPI002366CB2F|nr:DUF3040 domain-containing protein [Actinomycetospora lutea]MDD7942266.1 DUF3040 domain-containing protein [Actinomycetospora lutea]
MEPHEEPGRPLEETSGNPADRSPDPYDERFAGIVAHLAAQDPRFVRRVSAPLTVGLGVGDLMIVVALVATVMFGVVPLAIGVHAGAVPLVVVGVIGCLVLPAGAPLVVRTVLRRTRPLMP